MLRKGGEEGERMGAPEAGLDDVSKPPEDISMPCSIPPTLRRAVSLAAFAAALAAPVTHATPPSGV